jgi:hypothetical protein
MLGGRRNEVKLTWCNDETSVKQKGRPKPPVSLDFCSSASREFASESFISSKTSGERIIGPEKDIDAYVDACLTGRAFSTAVILNGR